MSSFFFKQNKSLFWDTDTSKLDPSKHFQFIIERILEKGSIQTIREIVKAFGFKKIEKVVLSSNNISDSTRNLWINILS